MTAEEKPPEAAAVTAEGRPEGRDEGGPDEGRAEGASALLLLHAFLQAGMREGGEYGLL